MTRPYENLDIPLVAKMPRPGMAVPGGLGFTPDGAAVTYLFSEEGSLVRSLWRYDIASGDRTIIAGPPPSSADEANLSREEELRRERLRLRELGVTSYQFARDADPPVLLIPANGRLQIKIGDGDLRELPEIEAAIDPQLSRDGRYVAFVQDNELFVASVDGSEPLKMLTSDGTDTVSNGLSEFIAQEELDRDHGFWWSPDGTRIAFAQADSSAIPEYPIVHQGKDGIDIERHRYPFAGQANAVVRLGIVDVETRNITWMSLDTESAPALPNSRESGLGGEGGGYLGRVGWRPDGVLTATLLSRDQQTATLLAFEPSGASRILRQGHQEPWLNLDAGPRFLESGEIVWTSERSGFRHAYVYDADGHEIRQLTSGEWAITSVAHVDEKRRVLYFIATRDSVLERHLYSVSLDGGDITRITTPLGWHGAVFSRDGEHFLDVYSTLKHAPTITLRRSDGAERAVIFADEGANAETLGLTPPGFLELAATDGTPLYGAIYRPPGFQAGTPYPTVVSVYGGPHAQRVADEWSLTVDLRAQYLAQQGFVVFKLDNRGSSGRGHAFEAHLARRMGTVEVDDQAAGVEWLIERGIADPNRIGIYGWSYGGYMTVMAMLRRPDLFKVGVAGAPVADWDGYDTAYTERYMSTPAENPDGYRDGSLLTHAAKLKGKLLLVHGMVDENVHFRHTARLIRALSEAGRPYDILIFPEERHMPRDQAGLEYQEARVMDYFKQWL